MRQDTLNLKKRTTRDDAVITEQAVLALHRRGFRNCEISSIIKTSRANVSRYITKYNKKLTATKISMIGLNDTTKMQTLDLKCNASAYFALMDFNDCIELINTDTQQVHHGIDIKKLPEIINDKEEESKKIKNQSFHTPNLFSDETLFFSSNMSPDSTKIQTPVFGDNISKISPPSSVIPQADTVPAGEKSFIFEPIQVSSMGQYDSSNSDNDMYNFVQINYEEELKIDEKL